MKTETIKTDEQLVIETVKADGGQAWVKAVEELEERLTLIVGQPASIFWTVDEGKPDIHTIWLSAKDCVLEETQEIEWVKVVLTFRTVGESTDELPPGGARALGIAVLLTRTWWDWETTPIIRSRYKDDTFQEFTLAIIHRVGFGS